MRKYLEGKDIKHQRVFIARSDPAMNYSMVSAILCNKIALQRLRNLSEDTGVKIYPILGAGSAPFRGHLAPDTVEKVLEEYPDVQTFTVPSAFKYDHPIPEVIEALRKLNSSEMMRGYDIDESKGLEIIEKASDEYRRVIEYLAPIINYVASFVPRRRMRKLHVGLFGYARSIGKTTLPRVISFCAACYSIGLPPEILGLGVLSNDDMRCMKDMHVTFPYDMKTAMSFFNEEVLEILPEEVRTSLKLDWGAYDINHEHRVVTSRIIRAVKDRNGANIQSMLVEAADVRKFLG